MIEQEINHKGTLKCVQNLQIDISGMKDMKELREYIKINRQKLYQRLYLRGYMREYMRNRYRVQTGSTGQKRFKEIKNITME